MKHTQKRIPTVFISLLLIGTVFPLWAAGTTEEAQSMQTKGRLRIAIMTDFDSIPLILADTKGYYAAEGIEVDIRLFKSPVDRDTAFQSGNVDGAISDLLAAGFALNGEFPVQSTSLTNGSYKMVLGPDESIREIRELKGRKVGISKNTIIEYCTDRMTAKAGLPSDHIEKVVIPQMPVRLEMLLSGKIAAATLPEPLASMAVEKGGRILDSSDKLGINPGILLFHREIIDRDPELIKAFYRAYNRSVTYINSTPQQQFMGEISKTMGLTPEIIRDIQLPEYVPAQAPSKREVEEVMTWLIEKNLVSRAFSYEEVVAPDLVP